MKVQRQLISIEIQNPLFIGGHLSLDNIEVGYIKGRSTILVEGIEAGTYTLNFYGDNFTLKNYLVAKQGLIHTIHLAHKFERQELEYRFSEVSSLISNYGDFSRIKDLISIPGILDMKSIDSGKTLLHMAVDSDFYEGITLLLEAGIRTNSSDKFGFTPLMSAVEKSNIHIVRLLLKFEVDINAVDCHNENALMKGVISYSNSIHILKLLLDSKIKTDIISKRSGLTPLLTSLTKKEFIDIFYLLIGKCSKEYLFIKDHRGYSAFDLALIGGEPSCIKKIMSYSIYPSAHSSIYKAIQTKDKDIIIYTLDYLLKDGLDIDDFNSSGITLLMFCCSIGYLDGVKLILDKGAQIDKKDSVGETALFYSLYYPEVCSFLIEKGAAIDAANLQGETPLMKLIPKKFQDTAKLFLN